MDRDHAHHHHHSGGIGVAFILNLAFTVLELVGGLLTNSMAILADALHDLGDSFTLGVSWYLEKHARKGRDQRYSYGYRRFSLLGALTSAAVLTAGSLFVLSEAVQRILAPEAVHAPGMVIFAIVGVAVNGIAAVRLGREHSLNAQMVMWHLVEDILGWAAVLAAGVVLWFKDIPVIDPVLSALITLYVLYNVLKNLRRTMSIFLQAIPDDVDVAEMEARLSYIEGVDSCHHTHVWSLDGVHNIATTHVVVPPGTPESEIKRIKKIAKEMLSEHYRAWATLEVEYADEECAAER